VAGSVLRSVTVGRVRIRFFFRRRMDVVFTEQMKTSSGYIPVSSPEMTAFDLVRYRKGAGSIDHIATVLAELAERLDAKKLVAIAEKTEELPVTQRLGYLLEQTVTASSLPSWQRSSARPGPRWSRSNPRAPSRSRRATRSGNSSSTPPSEVEGMIRPTSSQSGERTRDGRLTRQVEQDLALSRALVTIFETPSSPAPWRFAAVLRSTSSTSLLPVATRTTSTSCSFSRAPLRDDGPPARRGLGRLARRTRREQGQGVRLVYRFESEIPPSFDSSSRSRPTRASTSPCAER